MSRPEIDLAKQKIAALRGRRLSTAEREEIAIDLAREILKAADRLAHRKERKHQRTLANLMKDPHGKAFTTAMADQCFRSKNKKRIASQLHYLLDLYGLPRYLSPLKKIQIQIFRMLKPSFAAYLVPLIKREVRKETSSVILPGETEELFQHLIKRRQERVRINLNHLGEAILGEKEAKRRLETYLSDLTRDEIDYISIKISSIFSQISLLGREKTLHELADRLRSLYRAAMKYPRRNEDGSTSHKFINLDMEEYRDLHLTKELFQKVLSEKEFEQLSAGIVLQAYLPDAYEIQKELTAWAIERVKKGGAPIKIRIVKGANLAMEQYEASLRDWPQAPFKFKVEVDANFKRMIAWGCEPEHAAAVRIGIGSHNLFDISYALLLRSENGVESFVNFEMLEGMAEHLRRAVQEISGSILLYCPVATDDEFHSAIAYLIRRLDENTGPENFLRHSFGLKPGSDAWMGQVGRFRQSCSEIDRVYDHPRRMQNRLEPPIPLMMGSVFENEPDTDFSLAQNLLWAKEIHRTWHKKKHDPIPLVIAGKEIHHPTADGKGIDPAYPHEPSHSYTLADWSHIDEALNAAERAYLSWNDESVEKRCRLLSQAAHKMREKRGDLIGVMMTDGGKSLLEADPEVSEAIDFAEYYLRSMKKMSQCRDIEWRGKGPILIAPPWNFPVSIPIGGILAALVAGNSVIFKPPPEAVLTGWVLVNILWDAGIPKEVLQFVNCPDEPVGTRLIGDSRIKGVILTGATGTARHFIRLRPDLDLTAETGGKNAIIVTALSDRDLAVRDIVNSAFGHSGQKCSACSLAILEREVYEDRIFMRQLRDAVESLPCGPSWDFNSRVTPLIREASEPLLRGLTQLDEGEVWLVTPRQDPKNPQLWSPGVKYGVRRGSFTHMNELFGPVLGVMCAEDLPHALSLANSTPYGLTSGIHSLDEREILFWLDKIEAGNLYINRGTTGAIVRRQPFGGTKASGFGHGAKAGGPNYIAQFAIAKEVALPHEKDPASERVSRLAKLLEPMNPSASEIGLFHASLGSYAYWARRFYQDHDPTKIVGQDNYLRYKPRKKLCVRFHAEDEPFSILRLFAATLSCHIPLEVSWTRGAAPEVLDQWRHEIKEFHFLEESEAHFMQRLQAGALQRIRTLSKPSHDVYRAAAEAFVFIDVAPVLSNGRFELLHLFREEAISHDYHRYGNLGLREGETRHPIH